MIMDEFQRKKREQLDIAVNLPFNSVHSLDKVTLMPKLLPEIDFDEIDTSITIFDHTLSAPILIAPMTGGAPDTEQINMALGRIAHATGIGMSIGSQKAMLKNPNLMYTYQVRKSAPGILLFANIGAVDLKYYSNEEIETLITNIQADGIMVHLNPLQEAFQPDGDTKFSGVLERLRDLIDSISYPVIARSVGCGMDPVTAKRIIQAGVKGIDVAGKDGTNWILVEGERAKGENLYIAENFSDWGLDLLTSLQGLKEVSQHTTIIATGGITNGLQGTKALVLGARLFSIGRAVLYTLLHYGEDEVINMINRIKKELKIAMFGVGARNLKELQQINYLINGQPKQ